MILRAGEAPQVGDVEAGDDVPAYREVYDYVESAVRVAAERSPWFTFFRSRHSGERTEAWYLRFGRTNP